MQDRAQQCLRGAEILGTKMGVRVLGIKVDIWGLDTGCGWRKEQSKGQSQQGYLGAELCALTSTLFTCKTGSGFSRETDYLSIYVMRNWLM